MTTRLRPNGMVLWEGPGFTRGSRVAAIVTGLTHGSSNQKVGPTSVQVWILDAKINPEEAAARGKDRPICGDCKYRGKNGCYVFVQWAPQAVWKAWKNDRYPEWDERGVYFKGRHVRWGAYGDPALIPEDVIERVNASATAHTGFSHAWRKRPEYRKWFMASVDSPAEVEEARALGWKPYRVRGPEEPVLKKEFVCPASKEGKYRLTCEQCRVCRGGEWTGQATPVVIAHGRTAKKLLSLR